MKKSILFALLLMLTSTGCTKTITIGELEIYERPQKFPYVTWYDADVGGHCVNGEGFIRVTKHIVVLNHVLDLYELQVLPYTINPERKDLGPQHDKLIDNTVELK